MTEDEEAREAFQRTCELFSEMSRSLRTLGEAMASAAETFAIFAASVGHPVKCSVPCPACDEEFLAQVKSLREEEGT